MSTATIDTQTAVSKDLSYDFPAIQLARTGRFVRLIGKITLVILVVSLFAMFFAPWRQTARGTGVVLALNPQERPQSVKSPAKGVVLKVKPGLREGSRVEEGEFLMELQPLAEGQVDFLDQQILIAKSKFDRAQFNVENTLATIDIQKSWGESRRLALKQSLEAANNKYAQALNEVDVYDAELKDKDNQRKMYEKLGRPEVGLAPAAEVVTKQQEAAAAKVKLEKARNYVKEAEATLKEKQREVEAYQKEIDIKNQTADQKHNDAVQKRDAAEKELIDLKTKRDRLKRNVINAPCSGVIQQWFGVEGADTVKEGDQLFVIVPETDDLGVEMKVNGNDMPLIREGDKVRLQFEGWPAAQFVGWPSVAIGTFGGEVSRVFPTDDGNGNFRVLIKPDDNAAIDDGWPNDRSDNRILRQGVRANGWVLLDEVPLGYEIWRQLNGFPANVADDNESAKDKKKGSKVKVPKA